MGLFTRVGRLVVLSDDQDEALRFYRDVLGFASLHDETVDGLRLLHVGPEGVADAGLWLLPPQSDEERSLVGRQTGDEPLLVLYTDDLARVLEILADAGVEHWAVREDEAARSVHLEDPMGNVLVAVELADD